MEAEVCSVGALFAGVMWALSAVANFFRVT
jgi:hypothetical protein